MADYRIVKTKFWDDPYITKLDTNQKLLFLYLLTNSSTNISGAYEISLRKIQFDTSLPPDWVQTVLTLFETDKKVYYRDGWVYIPNFIKHQIMNESIRKGIENNLKLVPKWIQEMTRVGTDSPQAPIIERKKDIYKGDLKNLEPTPIKEELRKKWGTKK